MNVSLESSENGSNDLVELAVSETVGEYSLVKLDKEDVLKLINELQEFYDNMEDYKYE
jgi:hypothetical protein